MHRPRSSRAPKASRGVCLLASRHVRDSIGEVGDNAVSAGQHKRPESWLALEEARRRPRKYPGCSPPDDPGGVDQGSLGREPFITRLNIPLC